MNGPERDKTLEDAFGKSGKLVIRKDKLKDFLAATEATDRYMCVVTSGGSQVPLEKRAVRTLENFSTGVRGARCVEALLDAEQLRPYSVILLSRKGAALPYARDFNVTDFSSALAFETTSSGVQLRNVKAKTACKRLHEVVEQQRLFVAEYTTVQEYLFALRYIAKKCAFLKNRVMFCLAAAVSDFYVPTHELSEHKMQATDDSMTLTLRRVPKCLGLLSSIWAPQAFIVSFKLETDPDVLQDKAKAALETYNTHLVVGNVLHTRYEELTLVSKSNVQTLRPQQLFPIEVSLVHGLITRHGQYANGEDFCALEGTRSVDSDRFASVGLTTSGNF